MTLENDVVRLEPLRSEHADEPAEACRGLDGLRSTSAPTPETMAADIAQRLAWRDAGWMNPRAIMHDGVAVGTTAFANIDQPNRRVLGARRRVAGRAPRSRRPPGLTRQAR